MAASTVLSVEGSFVSFFKNNACTLAKLCLVAFPQSFFFSCWDLHSNLHRPEIFMTSWPLKGLMHMDAITLRSDPQREYFFYVS